MEFDVIGTHWLIEPATVKKQVGRIERKLAQIDKTWSRFRDDSLVAQMAVEVGEYQLSPDDVNLMHWYKDLYDATDGLVTPLIGGTLSDAGYDKEYSLTPARAIRQTPVWGDVIELKSDSIIIKQPCLIDVGAAGKGWAVDLIAGICKGDYCVDAGGDIAVFGKPMSIGLEDPRDTTKLIGVATITNESICGSALHRRSWGDWNHVINPVTSRSVKDVLATWAIAANTMKADGLATALFFVPPEKLGHLADFRYCVFYSDGSVRFSDDGTIKIFTDNN